MIETKVRLSLSVPGAQMLSEQACSENAKENYNTEYITVVNKKKGKPSKETIVIKTRKNCTVIQAINISREAYDYMTSADSIPTDKISKSRWYSMSKKQRLDCHCSLIAESLGAVGYTFEVFND